MGKRTGIICIALGAVMLLGALGLLLYNRQENDQAGQAAQSVLSGLRLAMDAGQAELPAMDPTAPTEPGQVVVPPMPTVEINGEAYIGYLALPELSLELPVISQWSYPRLQLAPCRHFGSTYTDDLVIAAHNYDTHFGRLKELEIGDEVTFTDMDGVVSRYQVVRTGTVGPSDVEAVKNSGNDLVLYTCTYGGSTRVVVFCDRVAEES